MKHNKKEKKGTASMICAIISLCLFLAPYLGLPLAILALVFAWGKSDGQASAGRTIGIISIVINSVILFVFVVAVAIGFV